MSPSATNGANGATEKESNVDVTNLGFVETPKVQGEWTVEKALAATPSNTTSTPAPSDSPLPFFHLLERLKTTKREGWRRFGIERCESIADHMFRMSLLSLACPPALKAKGIDTDRCLKMALVHDMAESLVGDITPVDGIPKPEKNRREAATMDYITRGLLGGVNGGLTGEEIRSLWQEYEDSETLESKFVHDLDKMELLLQMIEYERRAEGKLDLGEFAYVATKFALEETQGWADAVLKEREEFWATTKHVHGELGVEGGVKPNTRDQQDQYYDKEKKP